MINKCSRSSTLYTLFLIQSFIFLYLKSVDKTGLCNRFCINYLNIKGEGCSCQCRLLLHVTQAGRHTISSLMTSTDFSCSESSAITHREREKRRGDNSALLWKTRTPHVPWELGFQHPQALPLRPHATLYSSARLDYSYDGRQRWADNTWDCP